MAENIFINSSEALDMFKRVQYANVIRKKDVKAIYRRAVTPVRRAVMQAARAAMGSNTRGAYKAVKMTVYRDANGASVSLLDGKAAKSMEIDRQPKGGLSGIRRKRKVSERTKQVNGYRGKDRGFILRFVNQGTAKRTAGTRTGTTQANRGSIAPRSFFNVAGPEMEKASADVSRMMESVIEQIAQNK